MKASIASAVLAYLAAVSAQGVTSRISAPGSAPASCATNQAGKFGIQIIQQSSRSAMAKRQVTQIADGQIQAASATTIRPVTQIRDGQIQAATSATSVTAPRPVTQIADGQIQAATSAPVARPVSQIADGQIQAQTGTGPVTVTVTKNNCIASPITQIADGQIQAPMATPVTQIRDGQIQAPTSKAATGTPVSQIRDGQIQAPTTSRATTATPVSQIRDGQIQANTATTLATTTRSAGMSTGTSAAGYAMLPGAAQACASAGTLTVNLTNGVLLDSQGRTGYIAANSQFQFDAPAQTGAIYTAGWSVCSNGTLALGSTTTFYQCLSGSFYNIYLNNILGAGQCSPVQIEAIQLNAC